MSLSRHDDIDARYFQIAALALLLMLSNFWSDFGSGPASFAVALVSCLATQALFARHARLPADWRSPAITACSIGLLLRADAIWWFAVAGIAAMSFKALVRVRDKHLFNPANSAIVPLLLITDAVWISPGQWGQVEWLAGLMIGMGALVLGAARRLDIALAYLAFHAACLFGRALWLGDPITIPVHQLQTGSLIVFTCFMITDPRSTPDRRAGRIAFAGLVALVALYLQVRWQLVGAPLYALFLLSPLTPMIDRLLAGQRFEWRPKGDSHEQPA